MQRHEFLKQNYGKYGQLEDQIKNISNLQKEIQQAQDLIPQLEQDVRDATEIYKIHTPDERERRRRLYEKGVAEYELRTHLDKIKSLNDQIKQTQSLQKEFESTGYTLDDYRNFNPNSLNLGLSQFEAAMLGIQGGEGLYNILSQEDGIDNLIKTAQANKERLISQDEQSQLARLQSIAELANDYGSADSGIDFRNQYINRDLAGTQSALDALDMDHLRNALQGAEKQFRDNASGTSLTGYGRGKATSGGAFGTKKKTATTYLTENLGNLINKSGGYRNIYSDEGIDQDTVNRILGLAQGMNTGDYNWSDNYGLAAGNLANLNIDGIEMDELTNPATWATSSVSIPALLAIYGSQLAGNNTERLGEGIANFGQNLGGDSLGGILSTPGNILGEIGRGLSGIGSSVGGALFGSSKGLKEKAQAKANAAAVEDLRNQVDRWLANQGVANQLNVKQDVQRDLDLLELLGMLDTTNR